MDRGDSCHIREHLSEEELTLFDILLKPAPALTDAERSKVKAVARELVDKVKALLLLNWRWRAKAASRAQLKLAIEDALDLGLPRAYTPELYQQKCASIFEHFYVSYPERDASVYAGLGSRCADCGEPAGAGLRLNAIQGRGLFL